MRMCTCPPNRFRDPTLSVGELVMQALKFSYEGILINRCQQSPFTAVVSVPATPIISSWDISVTSSTEASASSPPSIACSLSECRSFLKISGGTHADTTDSARLRQQREDWMDSYAWVKRKLGGLTGGRVDPTRVFVFGGSAGATASLFLVRRTDSSSPS